MLHWVRPTAGVFTGAAVPAGPLLQDCSSRGVHARMLAHAATRRRAAAASAGQDGRVDALYWKACAPQAVAKARAFRALGLSRLP